MHVQVVWFLYMHVQVVWLLYVHVQVVCLLYGLGALCAYTNGSLCVCVCTLLNPPTLYDN